MTDTNVGKNACACCKCVKCNCVECSCCKCKQCGCARNEAEPRKGPEAPFVPSQRVNPDSGYLAGNARFMSFLLRRLARQ